MIKLGVAALNKLFFLPTIIVLAFSIAPAETEPIISPAILYPGDAYVISIKAENSPAGNHIIAGEQKIPLFACSGGRLCGIGVAPLNTTPGKTKLTLKVGAKTFHSEILVMKRDYPERHIKIPLRTIELSTEDLARTKKEAETLKAIWPIVMDRLFSDSFIMPLPNRVSTEFGVKRIFNRKKISVHQGIDISGAAGEEIKASNCGIVALADNLFYGGNTIIINHGAGIFTIYMHLDKFLVKEGDSVKRGQIIGQVGSTGRSTGPHLHFGLKILGISANPSSIIGLPLE